VRTTGKLEKAATRGLTDHFAVGVIYCRVSSLGLLFLDIDASGLIEWFPQFQTFTFSRKADIFLL